MQRADKKYVSVIVALVIGAFIALAVAEITVRIFFPYSRDHIIPGSLFNMDPELGWSFRKSHQSRHQTKSFDVNYKINALGYRDKERTPKKAAGTKRVLLYGDSQVFGWGLAAKDRYSNLLENRIANTEIWNLAVPAYGIDQELLSFEKDAKRFSPDSVILFTSPSTLGRTRYGYNYKKYKPQFVLSKTGELDLKPVPKSGRFFSGLLYKSVGWMYLPYFIERRLEMLNSKPVSNEVRERRKLEHLNKLNKRILLRAKQSVTAVGAKLIILCPTKNQKRKDLEAFSKEQGLTFIHIELSGAKEKWILAPTDHHYNPQAAKVIADQIEPKLRRVLLALDKKQ